MRASLDDSASRSMRPQADDKRTSTIFSGFGKSKPKATSPQPLASKPFATKSKSRFADSDDEDEPKSKVFRSRFEDSSDDEADAKKFRPVRGIPRKADEGDSTDLDDSSEDEGRLEKPKLTSAPKPAPILNTGNNAPVPNKVVDFVDSPRTEKKKKGGFFGLFKGKKVKDKGSPNISSPVASSPIVGITPNREAQVDGTMADIERTKSPELPSTPASLSSRGKLQRRNTPQRLMSDSWPLPDKMGTDEKEERPYTSDGVQRENRLTIPGTDIRPGMSAQRESHQSTAMTDGGTPVSSKTGKKKRFPGLRKRFGLPD